MPAHGHNRPLRVEVHREASELACEPPHFTRAVADWTALRDWLRCQNARLLKRLIEAVTLENTRAHWIAKLTAAGIPTGPIQTVDQVLKDPQILARNMVVDVLDKNGRQAFKAAGNPIKMTDAPDPTSRSPAPDLDGNRGEILRWLEQS